MRDERLIGVFRLRGDLPLLIASLLQVVSVRRAALSTPGRRCRRIGQQLQLCHGQKLGNYREPGEGVRVDTNAQANAIGTVINGNLIGVLNSGSVFQIADISIMNNATGISGPIISFGNNNIRNNGVGNGPPTNIGQQ